MAAVLACGEGALLSHRSAAALHELIRWDTGHIDITIPGRTGLSIPGIRIHRSMCIVPHDRVEVRGIPCTSLARTLLDVAATSVRPVLERACNQAEIQRTLDLRAVEALLERREGTPGARKLREALGSGTVGHDRTRSELERRFLALCKRAGIPRPSVNEWIAIAGEEMQCDFVWHAERVIVEVDGWATHRTRKAFQDDRRRDRLLRLHRWDPLRFTWDDIDKTPRHVEEVTRAILATPSRRR
jgi:hypothetical protein